MLVPPHTTSSCERGAGFFSRDHTTSTPPDVLAAVENAFRNSKRRAVVGRDTLVVGGIDEGPAAVFVSEHAENIRRNVRQDVFLQLLILTILGIAAAMIVNATLLRVLAQPVTRLAATVDAIAHGQYGFEAEPSNTAELQELAVSVNSMSRALALADRERRSQMQRRPRDSRTPPAGRHRHPGIDPGPLVSPSRRCGRRLL